METFRCQNPNCCKESDYSLAQIQGKNSTVLCQHCQTVHHLEILSSDPSAPRRLRAGGLYWHPG